MRKSWIILYVHGEFRIRRTIEYKWVIFLSLVIHRLWREVVSWRYGSLKITSNMMMEIRSGTKGIGIGSQSTPCYTLPRIESWKNVLLLNSRNLGWNTLLPQRTRCMLTKQSITCFTNVIDMRLTGASIWRILLKTSSRKEKLVDIPRKNPEGVNKGHMYSIYRATRRRESPHIKCSPHWNVTPPRKTLKIAKGTNNGSDNSYKKDHRKWEMSFTTSIWEGCHTTSLIIEWFP